MKNIGTNKELISVIIPMYNAERFVENCVRSVLNGIYQNIEILCIDDGSTDGTLQILECLQKEDHRIIILKQEHAGVSSARNHGLREAKGSYIAFIDSDDWVSSDYLSLMVKIAKEKSADIVICGYYGVNGIPKQQIEDTVEYQILKVSENRKIRELVNVVWRVLYRKEICPQFNESMRVGEDHVFNIRILSEHRNISIWKCTKRMYFHWWRPNSLISTAGIYHYARVYRDIIKEMDSLPTKKYALLDAAREALGFKFCIASIKGADQLQHQADVLLKEIRGLMVRSGEIPLSENAVYLLWLYFPKLYIKYRRYRNS